MEVKTCGGGLWDLSQTIVQRTNQAKKCQTIFERSNRWRCWFNLHTLRLMINWWMGIEALYFKLFKRCFLGVVILSPVLNKRLTWPEVGAKKFALCIFCPSRSAIFSATWVATKSIRKSSKQAHTFCTFDVQRLDRKWDRNRKRKPPGVQEVFSFIQSGTKLLSFYTSMGNVSVVSSLFHSSFLFFCERWCLL